MNDSREQVLIEATISPETVKYYVIQSIVICVCTVIFIPAIIVIAPLTYIIKSIEFKRISCTLTTRSVKINRGVFNRVEKSIPLDKITDAALRQGPIMRQLGIEMVQFETAGQATAGATAAVVGIENGRAFRDAVLNQRDLITESANAPAASAPAQSAPVDQSTLTQIHETLLRIEQKLTDADAS